MEILVIAAILGIFPGAIASRKGRSFLQWWFFGMVLFIVALPMALLMKPKPGGTAAVPQPRQVRSRPDNHVPGWLVIVALAGMAGFIYYQANYGGDMGGKGSGPTADAGRQQAARKSVSAPGDQWHYRQEKDPMGKGTTYSATLTSTNTVNLSFPYAGSQHGTLTLRTHPRHGRDLIFSIEKGQLSCSSYDGCSVLVRFDDGEPSKYSAGPPSDGSSEYLFIKDYSRFAGHLLKSNRVRISASIFQQGSPIFEFDVTGFDVDRYRPKGD